MMGPQDLRAEIPALADAAYFNYGAHGPSPQRVIDSVSEAVATHESQAAVEDPYKGAFDAYDHARSSIADLLGATPDEIALTESTTDGVNRVANAIDWEPGDVVVRTDLEHPAGILPWKRLERQGVSVRVVETENGELDTDAYAAAVEDAKLVCFSALTWTHGTVLPVETLVDIAAASGTFTLVDAVQVPGQQPVDVTEWGADAVVGAGHKWLLGPWGAGFLYVDRERADDLVPGSIGYRSVTKPTAPEPEYKPGARRFEIGSMSPGPHAGLETGIEAIQHIGLETIEARIEGLTDRLKDHIPEDRLRSPRQFHSGLVTVDVPDPSATVDALASEGIVIRSLPSPAAVRVSVHAVSTEQEVDAVGEALADR
jgi:selenocysteine lyase/cysteine desulfurase